MSGLAESAKRMGDSIIKLMQQSKEMAQSLSKARSTIQQLTEQIGRLTSENNQLRIERDDALTILSQLEGESNEQVPQT